jgi:hypothetical protein
MTFQLSFTSSTSSALSESNLHNLNAYNKPTTHTTSPNKSYYYNVDTQNPANTSSSSSNESVCSVFSLENSQMQPSRAPQKTKRSIKMGVHYATSYRPQDTV